MSTPVIGFKAPSLSPAGNLRHSTTLLLGALRVLADRTEADLRERTPGDSADRQRIHGLTTSVARTRMQIAAVELAMKAAA